MMVAPQPYPEGFLSLLQVSPEASGSGGDSNGKEHSFVSSKAVLETLNDD